MKVKDLLAHNDDTKIVNIPDIKVNKYLSLEFGQYIDCSDIKSPRVTSDYYFGFVFNMKI